jgi:hypothetical protein
LGFLRLHFGLRWLGGFSLWVRVFLQKQVNYGLN